MFWTTLCAKKVKFRFFFGKIICNVLNQLVSLKKYHKKIAQTRGLSVFFWVMTMILLIEYQELSFCVCFFLNKKKLRDPNFWGVAHCRTTAHPRAAP